MSDIQPAASPEVIEVRDSRVKLAGFFGLGLLCLSAFLLIALEIGIKRPLVIAALGWTGTAFFALVEAMLLFRFLDPRPRIRIDDEGVYDRTLTNVRIPWPDIYRIENHGLFIELHVTQPDLWWPRIRLWQRVMFRCSPRLGFSPLLLNLNLSSIDGTELSRIIQGRMDRFRSNPQS